MANILPYYAKIDIVSASNINNVVSDLGYYYIFFIQYKTTPQFSILVNNINTYVDKEYLGGSFCGNINKSSQLSNLQSLFPIATFRGIPTEFINSNYLMKLTFSNGRYATKEMGSSSSAPTFRAYNQDGSSYGIIVINSNFNPIDGDLNFSAVLVQTIDVNNETMSGNIYALTGMYNDVRYYASPYNDSVKNATYSFFADLPTGNPPSDPYTNAGDSTTGGGGGSWDNGSDPVGVPSLPSVGATNTGFITLFVPTQSQLKQVAEYLWGGLFDISTYLRLFEDPMDCILGLSVVPVSVPTSGSATITVGNIELSGISLPVASQQYVEVDCGSLTVDPYFGSYLDYEPYTKMSLFVPYSGVHTVNADDIMGRTVNLIYHIDILTGSLVAFLKCGDSVLYEFNGACGSNIPVNSMNYASTIENAIRIAVNIGTTVATAGASAPLTGAEAGKRTAYQEFGRGVSLAGSTADGALSLKPNIDRAGSLGGTTGLLGNQTPYFIVTRPRLCKPKDQNKIKGYPAFINYSVSDLVGKGYTEFDTILLKNLYLTDDEKNELESILEGGVYL